MTSSQVQRHSPPSSFEKNRFGCFPSHTSFFFEHYVKPERVNEKDRWRLSNDPVECISSLRVSYQHSKKQSQSCSDLCVLTNAKNKKTDSTTAKVRDSNFLFIKFRASSALVLFSYTNVWYVCFVFHHKLFVSSSQPTCSASSLIIVVLSCCFFSVCISCPSCQFRIRTEL